MQIFYLLRKTARRARRSVGGAVTFRGYLLAMVLGLLFLLHIAAMILFEGLSFGDAAWLTITTATTVGYGDMSATTIAGRWATVILMYVGGIFILAQLAGLVFESAQERLERRRMGQVAIKATGHIVIFGWREEYLRRVIREIRSSISELRMEEIIIVSPRLVTLPEDFVKENVLHVNGPIHDSQTLSHASVNTAARVAILPETGTEETAYTNLELIARLNDASTAPIIYASLNRNAQLLADDLGASDSLIFDENYPEILARAVITVGGEDVLDQIIGRKGVEMVIVHKAIRATVREIIDLTEKTATLLGVRYGEDQYDLHPGLNLTVDSERLIFLVDIDRYGSDDVAVLAIEKALLPLMNDGEINRFREPKSVGIIGSIKRADERYLQSLEVELEDQTITYLGAGVLSAGGKWKQEELKELDAVVLLAADPSNPATDAKTFLLIRQLRQSLGYRGRIIAEALLPESRARFTAMGANDILRPVVKNVDILARCILTGAEEVLDNLYSSAGDSELLSLEVTIDESWKVFSRTNYAVGLPIAFMGKEGKHIVPSPDFVAGKGTLYLLVDTERWNDVAKVAQALSSYSA